MAHRILGIDLGTYSVKVAVIAAGFRKTTVVDWLEQPVPPGPEAFEERAARRLGEMVRARGVEHDIPYAAVGGDALSLRVLDFPFQGLKRADLDKAVGAELEAQLPHDLDEIVYAFDVLAPLPPGQPGTRVLAAAVTRERIQRLLELTQREQCEPHAVL